MPQNGAERPFPPICVHSCVPTAARNSATAQQCTQTPQSGAEGPFPPICVHSCVRRPGGEAHIAGVVTQPPTHTNSRSLSNEVDFVVGWGEDVIGIEVKSGRVRSTGGLTAFLLRFPGARTLVIGPPACTVGSFLLREHDPFSARAPRVGLRRRSAVARLVRLWGRAFRKRTCATYRRSRRDPPAYALPARLQAHRASPSSWRRRTSWMTPSGSS